MSKGNRRPAAIRSGTKKSLGQHFLTDSEVLASIADHAVIEESGTVIEIGTGLGTLTEILANRASHVLTVEIDDDLIPVLKLSLSRYPNVKLIHGDFLKTDWEEVIKELPDPIQIVGNIPYYITTDIIRYLFGKNRLSAATLLVQKEVGLKLTARPGDTDYCLLSLLAAYYSFPVHCMDISRGLFSPPPNVDSSLIRMRMHQERHFGSSPEMEKLFLRLCASLFYMRRKTVRNNLIACFHMNSSLAEKVLKDSGIHPSCRGETLQLEDLYVLTENLAVSSCHS